MNLTNFPGRRWDDEDWAAQLTMAAYLVVLCHGPPRNWLDLQLDLWRALSATMARGDVTVLAEDHLAELAYVAYRIALPYGVRRSFLDLELELYRTFRRAVENAARESVVPRVGVAG
jgi:hypothetical protein